MGIKINNSQRSPEIYVNNGTSVYFPLMSPTVRLSVKTREISKRVTNNYSVITILGLHQA